MQTPPQFARVVDLGSNTLKCLAARRSAQGQIEPVFEKTLDVRLSRNAAPNGALHPEAMRLCARAAASFLAEMAPWPGKTQIVATAAVRAAPNRLEFARLVREETGLPLEILTGGQEARLIAEGARTDPALQGRSSLNLFDLGGGSLECAALSPANFSAQSLPLGAVFLTREEIPFPNRPVPEERLRAVFDRAHSALPACGFSFLKDADLAGCSGAVAAARACIFTGNFTPENAVLERGQIAALCRRLSSLDLQGRMAAFPCLGASRADMMPAALAVVLAVMDFAGASQVFHTLRNLRYGLALRLLTQNL